MSQIKKPGNSPPTRAIVHRDCESYWQHRLSALKPRRVAVAVGDTRLADSLSRLMRLDGHAVHVISNGLDLLEWLADSMDGFEECRPDLIIMDADLPGRRGLDLLADLRAVGLATACILIALRGRGVAGQARRLCHKAHNAVLFTSPFDEQDLRTAVMFLLEHGPDKHLNPGPLRAAGMSCK